MAEKTVDDWLDQTPIDPSGIPDDYADDYTDPELRWRLKEAIQASGKGGGEGEWSARKAQLLTQEYERRGGGYTSGKSDAQKSLERWTEQDWQTADGSADAASGDHVDRYLPRDAWALLTEDAQQEAEQTKEDADADGRQVADWPEPVRRVMTELGYADGDAGLTKEMLTDRARELDVAGRSGMTKDELKAAILDAYRAEHGEPTKDELKKRARALDIDGRSDMTKSELRDALDDATD